MIKISKLIIEAHLNNIGKRKYVYVSNEPRRSKDDEYQKTARKKIRLKTKYIKISHYYLCGISEIITKKQRNEEANYEKTTKKKLNEVLYVRFKSFTNQNKNEAKSGDKHLKWRINKDLKHTNCKCIIWKLNDIKNILD
ncbi:hypothetical protein RFI_06919 [Reticulomyxa filosa]|uniref:Uncharacterized protein n=1 Tax=Reticulomyxa filosa TaxID=46433 RepID=X6NWE0_RETFI|nr:hypothetical protein RFI_06919 [Reticulomyxa filosa]|eukprot:ETO30198.1 hypothetical protein RFI_06919 [Reticulomyxa filosa]